MKYPFIRTVLAAAVISTLSATAHAETSVEERLKAMETRLNALETENQALKGKLKATEQKVDATSEQIEKVASSAPFDHRVLDFQFREETGFRAKVVTKKQHETVKVNFVLVAGAVLVLQIVVMQFAITPDAGVIRPGGFSGGRAAGDFFDLFAGCIHLLFGGF